MTLSATVSDGVVRVGRVDEFCGLAWGYEEGHNLVAVCSEGLAGDGFHVLVEFHTELQECN